MIGILGLFDLFALLYLFRGLQLLNRIRQQWASLIANPLTNTKKQLAEQASFFVAVPPGVLLHELGHVLAVWLFGGQVVEFGYRVFWGFVRPSGTFTVTQDWFISLAGTLGNLIFGVALWLWLRHHRSAAFRYFALRAFRFQIYFALIYYPLFTIILPIGDWATIYDFGATPVLSGATAVFHAGLLLLFWYGDRIGWFEMPAFDSPDAQTNFEALQAQATANPQDTQLQLRYAEALRTGGATNRAKRHLEQLLAQQPRLAEAYLQRAALRSNHSVGNDAAADAEKALALGLASPRNRSFAHYLLGQHYQDREQAEKATAQYTQAIETAVSLDPGYVAHLHYGRSQAYRHRQQYRLARQDIQKAIELAHAIGDKQMLTRYRSEQEVIENHAGSTPPATSENALKGGDANHS